MATAEPFVRYVCPLVLTLAVVFAAPAGDGASEILSISAEGKIGQNSNITCTFTPPDIDIVWTFNKTPFSTNDTKFKIEDQRGSNITADENMIYYRRSSLVFSKTETADHGIYGCYIIDNLESEKKTLLNLSFPAKLVHQTESPVKAKISNSTILSCIFEGFNLTEVKWRKNLNTALVNLPAYLKDSMQSSRINETYINGSLKIDNIAKKDNGTYVCGVRESFSKKVVISHINLLVLDKPQIKIDYIKAIDSKRIFLNWTINDGNSPIKEYTLQYLKNGSEVWTFYSTPIKGGNISFIMKGLEPSNAYQLRINAQNGEGTVSYTEASWIKTLEEDPVFVPDVTVKGSTTSSLSLGWNAPTGLLYEYVHYYEISSKEKDSPEDTEVVAVFPVDSKSNTYMFDKLKPDTTYIFTVRACSDLTSECGNWSAPGNGSTMDGLAGRPFINDMACKHDNISGTNHVYVSWSPPENTNGKIIRYNVKISGTASFVNNNGIRETTTWGPKLKTSPPDARMARFDNMPANTNFTVIVSAVTRTKREGDLATAQCSTPPSTPPRDSLQGIRWAKVREGDDRWLFQLNIPRVTERNGAICCYRIFVVRMKNKQRLNDMPSPEHLLISSYKKVHNGKQGAGAYIAEIFTSETLETNVILGDGKTYGAYSEESYRQCLRCASVLPNKMQIETTSTMPTTTTSISTTDKNKVIINIKPNVNPQPVTVSDSETTTIDDKAVDTVSNIPPLVDVVIPNEQNNTSTEKVETKDKSHHAKKKKKMKRQDPSLEMKHFRKPSYERSQDYQNFEAQPYDISAQNQGFDSNMNDDSRFMLDNDFYINRRISHQNKYLAYRDKYGSNYNIDGEDSVKDEDMLDLEEDDTMVSDDNDEIVLQFAKDEINEGEGHARSNQYLKGHKIVSRQAPGDDFYKKMAKLSDPNSEKDENDNEKSKVLEDSQRTGKKVEEIEEIVDIDKIHADDDIMTIFDGQLDTESNYTGFVELLVHPGQDDKLTPMYSDYFTVLKPGPNTPDDAENSMLELVIKIIAGCLFIAVVLLIIVCAIHSYNCRKARQHGVEMHTLQHTLRNIYQGWKGGRHQLVAHSPPDMPPISKENLLAAYTERQADSGYVFQMEFELLPDCFPDRTMDASESKENQNKNRYPDIKAYDQTRVKLAQIDSVVGSDYINANIVMGYKERKKFICAQGPTDVTVDDFWRMIWEYNLELVVMLTNLEEYSKVKCSKYWPDQHQQDKMFNNINVHHMSEKRYSDYVIRELKISKQSLSNSSSNNQIIEANGLPKKNGVSDINNGHSSPTGTSEERIVHQYHFLMWKDFVAPEYPSAILKFIKRMNEACTAGRPILVHCSAGVGRTGTLVALDCLLQQLAAENQVAVFNTVCDLRRQRNFLVQSLKQYVFVYRALLEFAQYDDTEIPACRLKSTVDRLRQTAENSDTCLMEEEFEKLKQPILEVTKPCAAGRAPEHLAKNRNEAVVPYDHNRVILAPIPAKENSTYINASFIEGYDNSESYVIAQDPLPSTIADFWRMVFEQEITTIVMLSELGEGKCPRYWDDDEIQYDHINVTYLLSESCPYYTRREFQVTNTKNQDTIRVTQLQYHGWPTVSGQVPEVTRGLIELVGQSGVSMPSSPPILVHCSQGTDRSAMFVALSILTIQLRTEKRVDVSTVTRKLRSQRMGCLDTFLQYEFLHRAIVNYAELHNLLSDS